MKYGLTSHQLKLILQCFGKFPEIEKVILFGSRAMGNYKPGSDVDLKIMGAKVSSQFITRLFGYLNEEISVPFHFDLVHDPIPPELNAHIEKYGIVIYQWGKTIQSPGKS
jgi:predicted nucleotidyltransferase